MCENDMLLLDTGDYHCTKYNPYHRPCKLFVYPHW
jgi:hypothetical protein